MNSNSRSSSSPRHPIHIAHGAAAYRHLAGMSQLSPSPVLFSSSGFDIMDTITRLVNRPNPTVALGPVDFSCAFLVADALKPDLTIVYVNPAFTRLTGYESRECIGRNCRFLQWPNGALDHRTNELNALSLNRIRAALSTNSEFQISLINYRKNGDQFHNLITGIPVRGDTDEVRYWVGFQVDVQRLAPGPPSRVQTPAENPFSNRLKEIMGLPDDPKDQRRHINNILVEQSDDFLIAFSPEGAIQYASPRVKSVLGYDPEELTSQRLDKLLHDADLDPVMKEIRAVITLPNLPQSATSSDIAAYYRRRNQPICLMFRARRKPMASSSLAQHPQYVWLESVGRVHIDYTDEALILLSSRALTIPRLSWSQIEFGGGDGDNECWAHVSLEGGLILGVACGARKIFESPKDQIIGTRLHDWVQNEYHQALEEALDDVRVAAREVPSPSPSQVAATENVRPAQLTCMRAAITNDPRAITITLYPPCFWPAANTAEYDGSGGASVSNPHDPSAYPPPNSISPPTARPTSSIICRIRFPPIIPSTGGTTTRDYLLPFFYDDLPPQARAPSQIYAEQMRIHQADVKHMGNLDLFQEFRTTGSNVVGPRGEGDGDGNENRDVGGERWGVEIQHLRANNRAMRKEIEELVARGEREG